MAQAPDKPWGTVVWGKRKRMEYMEYINKFKPIDRSVTKVRFLLLGPSGAGKSSFVNSVVSIFKDRVGDRADIGNQTSVFRSYSIKSVGGGTTLNLAMCDTMGLAEKRAGLHRDDIVSIIHGHVPDIYQFRPSKPMTSETAGYVAAPTLNEKIYCVVYVIDASTVSDMPADLKEKLGKIRQTVSSLASSNIPQLVLMTKVDKADPSVAKDIRNIDQSETLQEKAELLCALLGVKMSIFPVKNYLPHEVKLNNDCDVMLLGAVVQMMRFADNYMDDIAKRFGDLSTQG